MATEAEIARLINILYILASWSTMTTVMLILARRDVKMGLKKWFLWKLRKQPIKLRYHGPDKTVTEHILATKGKGETLSIDDKKMLFIKSADGSTFFLDEEAIRRTDDGINEISYNYKSIMPLYPEKTETDAEQERKDAIERIKQLKKEEEQSDGYQGVQMENLVQYTDPKRLNRLIEFIKLAAKTEALNKATDMEKWVKYATFAAAAAALMGVIIWYTMDGKMIPMLQQISAAVSNVGQTVLNL